MNAARRTSLAVAVCLVTGIVATCLAQSVDKTKSRIEFRSKQMNVPVEGNFSRFAAKIAWNPKRPEASRAEVTVDLTTFDIGLDYVNEEAKGKDWFDVKNFPQAKFVSSAVKSLGSGRFEARGKLTLKGVTRDVVAPFTLKAESGAQVFEGMFPIRRIQYRVGEGQWGDTGTVADEVEIRFHIVATLTPVSGKN